MFQTRTWMRPIESNLEQWGVESSVCVEKIAFLFWFIAPVEIRQAHLSSRRQFAICIQSVCLDSWWWWCSVWRRLKIQRSWSWYKRCETQFKLGPFALQFVYLFTKLLKSAVDNRPDLIRICIGNCLISVFDVDSSLTNKLRIN